MRDRAVPFLCPLPRSSPARPQAGTEGQFGCLTQPSTHARPSVPEVTPWKRLPSKVPKPVASFSLPNQTSPESPASTQTQLQTPTRAVYHDFICPAAPTPSGLPHRPLCPHPGLPSCPDHSSLSCSIFYRALRGLALPISSLSHHAELELYPLAMLRFPPLVCALSLTALPSPQLAASFGSQCASTSSRKPGAPSRLGLQNPLWCLHHCCVWLPPRGGLLQAGT